MLCATFCGAEVSFQDRKIKFIQRPKFKSHFARNRYEVDFCEELRKCPNCACLKLCTTVAMSVLEKLPNNKALKYMREDLDG